MDDRLKHLLQTQVEREAGRPQRDPSDAMVRGRRKKAVTRLGIGAGLILLTAAIVWTAVAMPFADNGSPDVVGPAPATPTYTSTVTTTATADFTAPLFVETQLVSTDELVVRGITVDPAESDVPTAVIVSFPGSRTLETAPECVTGADLRLYSLERPEGDPTIAVYPSRVFTAEEVETEGRLSDNDGTLISNTPKGETPTRIPPSGWVSWDVTEIHQQWFSERHFKGNYESVVAPGDEIVFSLRDESGEGQGFTASFASLEYAEAHSNDDLFAFAPTLQLTIDEDCQRS